MSILREEFDKLSLVELRILASSCGISWDDNTTREELTKQLLVIPDVAPVPREPDNVAEAEDNFLCAIHSILFALKDYIAAIVREELKREKKN